MKCSTFSLGELVKIKYGKNQKHVVSDEGKIPIYGTGGIMGYATEFLYDKPSVLIGRKGTIGKVKYADHPFWTVDTLFYTEVNDEIVLPKFLFYLMSQLDLNVYNEGTTIPSLRTETLNRLEFSIPPLPIQRKIASILSALDDKIETNNAICRNLEEQAKCIFKNKYRAGSDFSQGTIGDVVTLQRGYDLPKSKMTKGPYPVVGSTDIIAYHNEYNCDELCIVMGRSGNVGRPRFYIEKIWAHNTSLFSKSFHSAEPVWVYYALSDIEFSLLMGGSAVPTLNRNHVHMQFLNIAPLRKQREFANEVMPLIWMIFAKEKENRGLATFRDNLLPKLMSGELAVENIN